MHALRFINWLCPMAQGGWGPGMGGYGMGYGMGWFGSLIMIAFWIAVIVGIVFLIRWLAASARGAEKGAPPEDSAMEILRRRFASGEISKEEFEERKKVLKP